MGSRVFTSNIKLWLSILFLLFLLLASYFGTLDEMIKGFRFHPTDAEAIELLWDKLTLDRDSIVQVGDSLVHVITQLKDICEFEPGELPGKALVACFCSFRCSLIIFFFFFFLRFFLSCRAVGVRVR